jgi:hypothetical protein
MIRLSLITTITSLLPKPVALNTCEIIRCRLLPAWITPAGCRTALPDEQHDPGCASLHEPSVNCVFAPIEFYFGRRKCAHYGIAIEKFSELSHCERIREEKAWHGSPMQKGMSGEDFFKHDQKSMEVRT